MTLRFDNICLNGFEFGGGIYTDGIYCYINGEISSNDANYGGGIYFKYDSKLVMEDTSVIRNNSAECGGAVYANNYISIVGGLYTQNDAKSGGESFPGRTFL